MDYAIFLYVRQSVRLSVCFHDNSRMSIDVEWWKFALYTWINSRVTSSLKITRLTSDTVNWSLNNVHAQSAYKTTY